MQRKAQKIHRQLGGNWAEDSDTPPKPKGMHWATYRRKVSEMERADGVSMAAWLGIDITQLYDSVLF